MLLRPKDSTSLLLDMVTAGAFGSSEEAGVSFFVHPEREGLDFLMDKKWVPLLFQSRKSKHINTSFINPSYTKTKQDLRPTRSQKQVDKHI